MHCACSSTRKERKISLANCYIESQLQYYHLIQINTKISFFRWEDCKQLLLTQNFFESLRFFDRDNVPLKKLRRLEKMIDRSSKFEDMEHGSQAILPLCTWLIALVDYHYAKMAVQPYRDRLGEAEKTLMDVSVVMPQDYYII